MIGLVCVPIGKIANDACDALIPKTVRFAGDATDVVRMKDTQGHSPRLWLSTRTDVPDTPTLWPAKNVWFEPLVAAIRLAPQPQRWSP